MTYKRIHNQELSIIIEQTENNSCLLYDESKDIYNEIKNLLDKKFPNQFKFRIQEKVGIDFFIKKMIKNENFTFVKYGDGELLCMIGVDGKNCDDHPYSLELKKLLEISFVKLLRFYDDVFLADWEDNLVKTRSSYLNVNNLSPKFADYDSFLTIKENINDEKLLNFYKLLKQSDRKKILVGPKKLEPVIEMLNINHFVEVPIKNAFSEYKNISSLINDIGVQDDSIYILCCSMMSCLICSDLKEKNTNITILDVGSGLDPIFSIKTRPNQPDESECFRYFSSILPKNYRSKKTINALNQLNMSISNFK